MRTNPRVRFFKMVFPEPNTGCWLWSGGTGDGYGRFHDGDKMVGAHRFSYELHKGQIPAGLIICHACDNPSCVNPDHLFLGTFRDNMDDAIRKNRRPVGELIHCAKLKNADILEIRRRLSLDKSRGITVRIAKDYGNCIP